MLIIGYRAIYDSSFWAAIKTAKRNGFGAVEVHLSSPQFWPDQYSKQERQKIKGIIAREGIILQIHAPLEQSLLFTDLQLRKSEKKHLKTMSKFCSDIGARSLTIHPGKAPIYHTIEGKKIKDDNIYAKVYSQLFEDNIKYITSLSFSNLFICIENTDNFTSEYQKIIAKYLPSGKVFLTWDIRKNYSYTDNKLKVDQWNFLLKNKKYVKNIHVSGFDSAHGSLKGQEDKYSRFFDLFGRDDLPVIVEILSLKYAKQAKEIIKKMVK